MVVLSLRERDSEVVSAAEIIGLLGSEQTARKVIGNLVRKGWLTRLVGGRYMFLPPEHGPENLGENNVLALASAVVDPSYVGWWSAAAYHGFTTQRPMSVTVAVLRQTRPQIVEGSEIRFVAVTSRKFFGSERVNVYGRTVTISSPEKTLVDCIDRPDLSGGTSELARIVHAAMKSVDADGLVESAFKMGSTALLQRLGFLTDLVGCPLPEILRARVRAAIPRSFRSRFGRAESRNGDMGYDHAWGLFVNVAQEHLMAEVPGAPVPAHA